jgi:hypothetical protein
VPFNAPRAFRIDEASGSVVVLGRKYRLWYSRPIPDGAKIKTACFAEDARGRWYFNVQIEVAEATAKAGPAVAIDLGLKDLATLSDGSKIEMPAFYRAHEARLALAQQRGQTRRATALHAKTKNCRKHFLHVNSTRIVREHARVIVGCERVQTGEDADGKIRARRRMVDVPNDVAIQVPWGRRIVRSRQRKTLRCMIAT